MLDATQLLAIPADRPERLFSGDNDVAVAQYRQLTAAWHPDRHPGDARALAVFQHVASLYRTRTEQMRDGTWRGVGFVDLKCYSGTPGTLSFKYFRQRPFELGHMYIGSGGVLYVVYDAYSPLIQNALGCFGRFEFANEQMRKEVSRYLPAKDEAFSCDRGFAVIVKKTPDLVSLRDLLDYSGGTVAPEHVAWILSSLHNLLCYLDYANIAHNAIDLDTYFVSPEFHSGALLGGWWYAAQKGSRITHLPARSAALWRSLPHAITEKKRATGRLDRAAVRLLGRELLGDAGGTRIMRNLDIPAALTRWVTLSGGASALADYQAWEKARASSFPARRFVTLGATSRDIYPEPAPSGA